MFSVSRIGSIRLWTSVGVIIGSFALLLASQGANAQIAQSAGRSTTAEPLLAQDARSLDDESFSTRATFAAVWGDRAAARWIEEHNVALAGGQAPSGPHVAFLSQGLPSLEPVRVALAAFVRGLRDAGYSPGKDLQIDWRFAEGRLERLPGLADELVGLHPAVLVTSLAQEALAAKRATSTIPIVTSSVLDPVGSGMVASLEHPGGNLTGMLGGPLIDVKRLELLKEMVPGATRVAVLVPNATGGPTPSSVAELQGAAPRLGVQLQILELRSGDDFAAAFDAVRKERADALMYVNGVGEGAVLTPNRSRIAAFAQESRIPAAIPGRQSVVDFGGLMSVSDVPGEQFRLAAGYVDKILKGARPGDLPMVRATGVEFVISLKGAEAIGLTVPQSVLDKATEIIR
jgi:putative ABC transport system substrate-binding protein